MSRFRSALALLREINAVDLLLPIGGALIASGMHNLTEREARQRHRLAALQSSVQTHLDALLSAGVDVGALAVDERHPLDQPGLAGAVNGIVGNGNSETSSNSYLDGRGSSSGRRRGWKLAAAALAGAAGVAYAFRGQLAEIVLPYLDAAGADAELAADEHARAAFRGEVDPATGQRDTFPAHSHDYTAAAESTCSVCGAPGVAFAGLQEPSPWDRAEPVKADLTPGEVKPDLTPCEYCGHPHDAQTTPHPAGPPAPAAEPVDEPAVEPVDEPRVDVDECGWPGCTWTPRDATRGAARVTALAVHRSKCVHRPPSYTVPGA